MLPPTGTETAKWAGEDNKSKVKEQRWKYGVMESCDVHSETNMPGKVIKNNDGECKRKKGLDSLFFLLTVFVSSERKSSDRPAERRCFAVNLSTN